LENLADIVDALLVEEVLAKPMVPKLVTVSPGLQKKYCVALLFKDPSVINVCLEVIVQIWKEPFLCVPCRSWMASLSSKLAPKKDICLVKFTYAI
jgi:hypothetical protein